MFSQSLNLFYDCFSLTVLKKDLREIMLKNKEKYKTYSNTKELAKLMKNNRTDRIRLEINKNDEEYSQKNKNTKKEIRENNLPNSDNFLFDFLSFFFKKKTSLY